MKDLFKTLFQFLRSLFGGKKEEEDKKEQEKDKNNPQKGPGGSGDLKIPAKLDLKRYDIGSYDILGKLYYDGKFVCYTIEHKGDKASVGSYPLVLRTKGGLHATYGFRFKDIHKGMIQLDNPAEQGFAFIRTGNVAKDSDGGIVLGTQIEGADAPEKPREVWHSDDAYRDLYPKIANRIANGEKITLHITVEK